MTKEKKIAVVGLGYVGLPLAIEFGKIRQTIGFDISDKRISELKKGEDITLEIDSKNFKKSKFLNFTSSLDDIKECSIYIITVPTPIDKVNRPDLSPLIKASTSIAQVLKKGDIVIYESTVFPGCTEEICVPILEKNSNLKYNEDFFCGYSPERINPGDKVNTITKIKKITSGSNSFTAKEIDSLYKTIIEAGTFCAKSIKVAEAAKVIENTQRDLNIALINELSVIFERLDIDTMDVLEAAGSKWNFLPFRPGLVGGHCIGVDPYYLTYKAEDVGYNPQVILAGRRINDNMSRYAVKKIIQKMIKNNIDVSKSTVGILGVTFKENCPDMRNSKIIDLVDEFRNWGVKIVIVDPWADSSKAKSFFGQALESLDALNDLDSIVVAVGHNEFRKLEPKTLRGFCKNIKPVLADIKSIYDKESLIEQGFSVFRL